MIYALTIGSLALVATTIAGYPAVNILRRLKVGKEISEWGPETHQVKAGTPTMGGILVMLSIAAFTIGGDLINRWSIGLPLLTMGCLALIGIVDDLGSLQGRPQHALTRRAKLAGFLVIGAGAAYGLHEALDLNTVNIPYHGRETIHCFYIPIALGVIVLTAGGVAVTDGLDGLVAGSGAIAYGAYGFIALYQDQTYLGAFCLIVVGALLGFLWSNSYPARMFMGDSGALPLGGGLAVVAFMTGQWLVLPLIGIVFVVDGLSVALQVGYYRISGGKRIFKMAPVHHHFEKIGWSEVQVTQRFWIIGALGAAAGTALALEVYS
jgi:phospho-N-acetylmuramoyl-pentapeptide-transferase